MKPENEWIAYVNGDYVRQSEAKISIFDHVVLYGDGVFDTCCSRNGYIFKLEQHLNRLYQSAKAFLIEVPLNKEALKDVIIKVVETNGAKDQYIKCLVTRGVGARPLLSPAGCKPSVIVFSRPTLSSIDPEREGQEIRAKITSTRRTPPQCLDPKVKNLNYANQVMAKIEAMYAGVDEAVLLDVDGYLNEATAYSIFMVKDGKLFTPSAENLLNSITRETVFEIAEQESIEVKEGRFVPYDLYTADEVFFAATAGGIVPIAEIDGRRIGDGKPGPITTQIAKIYWDMLENGVHGTPYKKG